MAATSNPFYVEPPNVLSALLTGVNAYDSARKEAKQRELENSYAQVGQQISGGGAIDKSVLGRIIGMGPQAAPLLTAIGSLNKGDQTDTLKNLAAENASRAQRGLPPLSPLQYQSAVATAGANKSTINMPPMEKAYDAKMGGELAEMNVGIIKNAAKARSALANYDRLGQILQDPAVYQGFAGDKVLEAKKLAKSVGIDVGDVGGAEAAKAISNQLALQARNPADGAGMPGAMSDSDRVFLQSLNPGLNTTPEGNQAIIEVYRRTNQRALQVEKLRQDYIRKNGRLNEGFYRDLSEYSNANPLFADMKMPAARSAPTAPPVQGARRGNDGNFYVPDPNRPGKYLRVVQ